MDLYTLDREIRAKGRANVLTLLWSARGYLWRLAGTSGTGQADVVSHVRRFKLHMGEGRRDQAAAAQKLHARLSAAWMPLHAAEDGLPAVGSAGTRGDVIRLLQIKEELRLWGQRSMQAEREARRIKVRRRSRDLKFSPFLTT